MPICTVALEPALIVICATVTVPDAVDLAGFIQKTPQSLLVMPCFLFWVRFEVAFWVYVEDMFVLMLPLIWYVLKSRVESLFYLFLNMFDLMILLRLDLYQMENLIFPKSHISLDGRVLQLDYLLLHLVVPEYLLQL